MKLISTKKLLLIYCTTTLFSIGCKKDTIVSSKNQSLKMVSGVQLMATGSPIPSLDWENISFMPTPAGTSPIPVPWQAGLGGTKIDDDLIFDYQSANGWQLVYNTFTTTASLNPQYFMLYNKYRGLLRVYFYISPGGNYPSSNIVYNLNLRGALASSSPLLNFAAQDIIDFNSKSQMASQIQPYKVSTTGSWYAAEFEMAYDPATTSKSYDQYLLNWQINPNSITNISLNGLQTGDVSGTLTTTSGGPSFFGNASNTVVDAGIKFGSGKAVDAIKFLPDAIKTSLGTAVTSALGGIVKGFLGGIIGGTSHTSVQKVALKINSKITTTGTASVSSQLFDNLYSIPGTLNVNNTLPYYPNVSDALGVFYITAKPVVKRTVQTTFSNATRLYDVDQRYDIDNNSFQLVFNPAVLNSATIGPITKEIVMLDVPTNISGLVNFGGDLEKIAERSVYTGAVTGIERTAPRPLLVEVGLAVRISFDVIPKDGSPSCKIVKTFLATRGGQ
jgi:hypothetical protein